SRRRHTRSKRDWSSDVCSSDLWSSTLKLTQTYSPSLLNETSFLFSGNTIHLSPVKGAGLTSFSQPSGWIATSFFPVANNREARRSEERRVGKEGRCRGGPGHDK